MTDVELLAEARASAKAAYAPYSKFHVGAAVLARDGRVITGVNVENASYPLGVCAERAALSRAVAEGIRPGGGGARPGPPAPSGGGRQGVPACGGDRVGCGPQGGGVGGPARRRPAGPPRLWSPLEKAT